MEKLVVHHIYRDAMAWDLSGNFNHGEWQNATNASSPYEGARISGTSSRIHIRPSTSLTALGQIRVRLTFVIPTLIVGPPVGPPSTLVEPDGLPAAVIDSTGRVSLRALAPSPMVVCAAPGQVVANAVTELEYTHDGVNTCSVTINGATAFDVNATNPVSQVGPRGVSIGNDLAQEAVAALPIYVSEFQMFKQDPLQGVRCLGDLTAVDAQVLRDAINELSAGGHNVASLQTALNDITGLSREIMLSAQAGDISATNTTNAFISDAAAGLQSGDLGAVSNSLAGMRAHLLTRLGLPTAATYETKAAAAFGSLPPLFQDQTRVAQLLRALNVKGF